MTSAGKTWDQLLYRFGSARDRSSTVGLAVQEHTDEAAKI